jgi:Membrane-bound toxin component of toxin-antitoxin system
VTRPHTALYTPLSLTPGASRRLAWGLVTVHGLAVIVGVLPLPVALGWRLLVSSLLIAVACHDICVQALRCSSRAILTAEWHGHGIWRLRLRSGRVLEGRLLGDSYVSGALVVLNFRTGRWGRRSLVLTSGNCDPDQLRRLRVRLRLEQGGPTDGGTSLRPPLGQKSSGPQESVR